MDTLETAAESPGRASCVLVPTALYRHFDADGKLLYVGVSLSAVSRLAQHRDHSHWFPRIATMTTQWYPSRPAALEAERAAVRSEGPECNIQLRETKAEQEFRLRVEAQESRKQLVKRVVLFKPVYSLPDVAEALGYVRTSTIPRKLITEGRLGSITEGPKTWVTGWQLIDYLESLGGKEP